jgi:hypothetical protein
MTAAFYLFPDARPNGMDRPFCVYLLVAKMSAGFRSRIEGNNSAYNLSLARASLDTFLLRKNTFLSRLLVAKLLEGKIAR